MGPAMATASDKLRADLQSALRNVRAELERIQILAAVLESFGAPVPDYEPAFHHLKRCELGRFEVRAGADGKR